MSFRLPSTPARSLQSQPSTTPAEPPPTWLTDKSTTPAGPPPRMNLNSSYIPSNNTFGTRGYAAPDFDDDDDIEYDDDDADMDADGDAEGDEDLPFATHNNAFLRSMAASRTSARGLKRSHDGIVRNRSVMGAIAKGMVGRSRPAPLQESDGVILSSEKLAANLDASTRARKAISEPALVEQCAQFSHLWSQYSDPATKPGTLGPNSAEAFSRANYLASLLLQLHSPHAQNATKQQTTRLPRNGTSQRTVRSVPVPQALLKWLDTYHVPFPDDFDVVHLNRPSPSAHDAFWDIVFASALRGKLDRVIRLLRDAGWENACTALDDGSLTAGYTGSQLENTNDIIDQTISVLETCPAVQYADWDVKSGEWSTFRQRIRRALDELETLSGGDLDQSRSGNNMFRQSFEESTMSMSTASRRAESRVPYSIADNLSLLYRLLLGEVSDIMLTSQDWLEASIYLTVWWDGSDDLNESDLSRSSMRRSTAQKPREVDVSPLAAYRTRLAEAFAKVTHEPEDAVFAPNTNDVIEVGLACVLEDNITGVISILRTLSMTITVSLVELATIGDWLPFPQPKSHDHLLSQGLSKEDLLVLSHGPTQSSQGSIDRDRILGEYADLLASRPEIQDRPGWELAIAVLNRLNNSEKSTRQMSALLDEVPIHDEVSIDKVLAVCDNLGLAAQRRVIAERYADSIAESNSQQYGAALFYYARAQASTKIRSTLELLTSLSLLHSAAIPTAEFMDSKLESFLGRERAALRELADTDLEAAQLLSSQLSGYATLRKFFDLRDQDVAGAHSRISRPLKSLERKRQAAAALFGVIKSAADCIPGGLYDREAESVISVEGLLVLFGEALPLLGQEQRLFTEQQIFALLAIVEDYVAAPARVHDNADSLLSASLSAYQEGTNGGQKKATDLSASSSWDMLASQSLMLQSQSGGAKVERAWDWRQGLIAVHGVNGSAERVVALFREALTREVANGWAGLLNW